MSGGRPSGPQTAVGDHPSCTSKARKDGETAGSARSSSEGLGLDGEGVADPNKRKKNCQPQRAGIKSRARNGSRMAEATGSVHDSPACLGCAPKICSGMCSVLEICSCFVPVELLSELKRKRRRILLGMDANDTLAIHQGGVRWCKQGL